MVTALLILGWAKLLIGGLLILMGVLTTLRSFVEWSISTPRHLHQVICAAGEHLIGVIVVLAGFYIACW